jgi:hypothetical protein
MAARLGPVRGGSQGGLGGVKIYREIDCSEWQSF